MKHLNKIICALCCTLLSSVSFAHDFSVTTDEGKIFFFNIVNTKSRDVELTYEGDITSPVPSRYVGEIVVPKNIKFRDKVYTVTKIGDKAFSNARRLTGITLPSGIGAIGDFAFEGCVNLRKVVFPGDITVLGEGIFFGCTSISDVSLGSDWTSVNLKMFMWSNALQTINIPAKIARLQNLKSLKSLKQINVDVNNANYSSVDGVLYNKNRSVLLGCPRSYEGLLTVVPSVVSIYYGSLIDCPYITKIDLPISLKKLSFMEFSRMRNLDYIIMRNPEPIATAYLNGKEVFAIKVANPRTMTLVIPNGSAAKRYGQSITSISGEYTAVADIPNSVANVPIATKKEELISRLQVATSLPKTNRRK